MKKQNKDKFEYVDQFRKISTLEKLPKMLNLFEDEAKQENSNFMRLRKEPIVDRWDNPQHREIILQNECVEDKVNNRLEEETDEYKKEDTRVRQHINMYKNWSQCNKKTQDKNQSFKFFYKNASPPKKIASDEKQQGKSANARNKGFEEIKDIDSKLMSELDFINFSNQKYKYDFFQINQKRTQSFMQEPQKIKSTEQQKEQEDIFNQTFRKFEKYKSLQSINQINQCKMTEQNFTYDLSNKQDYSKKLKLDEYFMSKFIYKSVVKSLKSTEKDVEYFRDIGLPSRNLQKYTQTLTESRKGKDMMEEQTKEQAHYLHLLRQSELNINKAQINFDDVSNISNGRVTSLNAYMCIRSEKVTKAQFEKLLKRLDKYKKQQMEKGKQRVQCGVITDDNEIETGEAENVMASQDKNSLNELVNEIFQLRQSTVLLKNKPGQKNLSILENAFNKEKYTRMQYLLKKIYEKIIKQPNRYPLSLIEDHLDKINTLLLPEYKNGKILWFILECYEQILKNLPDQDNIRTTLKRKPVNQPILSYYKGNKLIKQEKIKAVNLFTYINKRNQVPTHDRSRTPRKSTTPIKSPNKTTAAKTPIRKPNFTNQTDRSHFTNRFRF